MPKKILLIDVSSLVFRAYFALPFMSTSKGQPTNAIYGFVNMFWMVKRKLRPELIVACSDCKEPTFREEMFKSYKSQREEMPSNFYSQIPYVERFLEICGVPLLKAAGYEADDLVATIVRKMNNQNQFYILSSDKDLMQLVGPNVFMCNYFRGQISIFDESKVKEKYGVFPQQFVDYLSLVGDSSDNIPGISGIGVKTAASLLSKFKDLEGIYTHLNEIENIRIREALSEGKGQVFLNRKLIKVRDDVNMDLSILPKENKINELQLYEFYEELEFSTLIKRQFPKGLSAIRQTGESSSKIALIEQLPQSRELNGNFVLVVFAFGDCYVTSTGERVYKFSNKTDSALRFWQSEVKKIVVVYSGEKVETVLPMDFSNTVSIDVFSHLAAITIKPQIVFSRYSELPIACSKLFAQIFSVYRSLSDDLINLLWNIEAKIFRVVVYMNRVGLRIDKRCLISLAEELQDEIEKVEKDIFDLLPYKINLNSPKQLAFLLFEKLGLPVVKKGRTHPSTSEQVLKKLKGAHPVVEKLLTYRELTKIMTGYINPLLSLTGNSDKIYATFSLTNTQTGRITAIDPNLQTIPIRSEWGRRIRQAFISRFDDGYILSGDYSQIELRVLAHISQDETLISAFKEELDVHKLTAARLFDKRPEEISSIERDIAKRVNFGIIYGMSPRGLAEDVGLDYNSARKFIDAYFQTYPRVKEFIDRTISQARINGYVKTMFGRIRYLPELQSRIKHVREFGNRAAVNTIIQGSAAEIIKLAMISIYEWIKHKRSKLILQVHDELVFDVPKDELEELISEVKNRMERAVTLSVPLRVDIAYGKNWLQAKG